MAAIGKVNSTQKDDGSCIVGNPIGKEEILQRLQFEMINYSPEEIIDIVNKEFACCDNKLFKASREMGFSKNWKTAQEKVKICMYPQVNNPKQL